MSLFKAECFVCHGDDKAKGGLSLATREALIKGGDEGVAVVPGKPGESRLLSLLQPGGDPHMPPKKQLDPAQIQLIREWIQGGALWDADALRDDAQPILPVELSGMPATYHPVAAISFSPDATRLAVGRGGKVSIHDLSTTNFSILAESAAHLDAVQSLAWSPDGRWLASGGFRKLMLWNAASMSLEREVSHGLIGRVSALEFSADGTRLVAGDGGDGRTGFVRILELPRGGFVRSWKAHQDTLYDVELSRDGSKLLTSGGDKLIKIWDFTSQKELAVLEGHTAQVLAATFNTNATQVASAGADKQLKVWDIATREKIIALGSHGSAVTGVAWPGEGSEIFAAISTGSALCYKNLKSHTGEQSSASGDERKLGDSTDAALCLAVSATGKLVAVGGNDGTVHVWDRDGKLLKRLLPPSRDAMPVVGDRSPEKPRRSIAQHRTAPGTKSVATNPPSPVPILLPASVVSLTAEPAELTLSPNAPRNHVVVTAKTTDGFDVDVTDLVRFKVGWRSPFEVRAGGEVVGVKSGTGVIKAKFGRGEVSVPVKVLGDPGSGNWEESKTSEPSFVRDVLPALSQAGCSGGSCHAKPEGQNGFKLSVFSYDPKADYDEIVNDSRGRRVFPAAPDESLLLKKPMNHIPHEGGQRFKPGSETHQLLVRWMRAGMPFSQTNEAVLQGVTAFPKERRYRKGSTQRLLVHARYSDGSVRDVTRLASFDSNDKEMARVDEQGRVTVGTLTGQGVVVARYMGFVADAQIMVPAERVLPASRYAALPKNNFIDELAYGQFQKLGLFPSELCSDAEFLRRAKLDAVGLLPSPEEVEAFLSDPAPDKRNRLVARVLEDPAYADYWANKWADLLRPNPDRVGVKSVFTLDQWLRDRFRENQPYDQFVRDILLAEGTNHRNGPAVIYRDRREPAELTTMFSQLFLGTRLECAKCHHHPNEKWSQDDFYQLAAFFGPVKQKGAGLSPPISAGSETFYFAPGGQVKHPVSGEVMTPRPLDGPVVTGGAGDPRKALADWMTSPVNPYFARAAVNRVWGNFFGRGMVHPVDDFRISNPGVNPALLDALAVDFAAHGYDLKHLMRTILESRLYQLGSTPNESNMADTRNFSRSYRRRLPAEVMVDAVSDVTGVPDTFAALPPGSRAVQAWSYKIESHFMDAFGRPNSSSDCPCERDTQLSVVQSLHLMNSRNLQAKLAHESGRVRRLASSDKTPEQVVQELYLAALNRRPTTEEMRIATAAFAGADASRQSATEDVLWALLNSPEFVFNH